MEKGEMNMAGFWDKPLQNLLQLLQATPAGLTAGEAKRRLSLYGPNSLVQELHSAGLLAYLRFFANPPVIILLVDSGLSLGLRDYQSSLPALRGGSELDRALVSLLAGMSSFDHMREL